MIQQQVKFPNRNTYTAFHQFMPGVGVGIDLPKESAVVKRS